MCALAGSSRIIAIIISNKNFLKQVSSIFMGMMEPGVEKEARDFGGLLNFMYFNAF